MTNPNFTSDDLDDVRGIDLWAKPAPVAPPPVAGWCFEKAAQVARGRFIVETDPDFLAIVAPNLYLLRGMYVAAFAKGYTQTRAYSPMPLAGKKIRCALHQTGVI